jgi:hypothetical protein
MWCRQWQTVMQRSACTLQNASSSPS